MKTFAIIFVMLVSILSTFGAERALSSEGAADGFCAVEQCAISESTETSCFFAIQSFSVSAPTGVARGRKKLMSDSDFSFSAVCAAAVPSAVLIARAYPEFFVRKSEACVVFDRFGSRDAVLQKSDAPQISRNLLI